MTGSTAETRDVGTGGGEEPKVPLFKAVWNPRMLICVFIGFSSGAPYWYVYSLIPYWLRTNDVSLISIGSLAVLQLPFTWKFLVAPLLDRYAVASFGRRRTWMLGSQITLMLLIAGMGFFNPKQEILGIAYLYFFVVCGAALQDIAIDAYRREILPDNELGLGSAFHVNAWRYASLASFSLPVILSAYIDWRLVHIVAALCMLPGLLLTLTVKEPKIHGSPPKTLRDAVILPFKEFLFERRGGLHKALYVLAFMLLYKFGDALATALITPFYVDMGFGPWEIGLVSKGVSLTSAGVGIFAGGFIMFRIGINKSIWMFGVVQLLSILGLAFPRDARGQYLGSGRCGDFRISGCWARDLGFGGLPGERNKPSLHRHAACVVYEPYGASETIDGRHHRCHGRWRPKSRFRRLGMVALLRVLRRHRHTGPASAA